PRPPPRPPRLPPLKPPLLRLELPRLLELRAAEPLLLAPPNALPEDDGRLPDPPPDRFWKLLVVGAGRLPAPAPVEGRAAVFPVEGRFAAAPVEGLLPTAPVEGRAAAFPVEGRDPTAPVEGLAPLEPQPRASRVLAEAPLLFLRFWSGCHFCAGCWVGRFP